MSAKGNAFENFTASVLRAGFDPAGEIEVSRNKILEPPWVVGSMRQALGAGDLIAARNVRQGGAVGTPPLAQVMLVECKANRTGGPFKNFSRADRRSMLEYAELAGASAWLAYRTGPHSIRWIPSEEWPK